MISQQPIQPFGDTSARRPHHSGKSQPKVKWSKIDNIFVDYIVDDISENISEDIFYVNFC